MPKWSRATNTVCRSAVVHHERKHAVQPLHALGAVLRVHRENDLGVRGRVERVAALLQFRAQLNVVVDLAIEADRQRPPRHGLCARHQVDDGQPLVIEADGAVDEAPLAVRSAMANGMRHVGEHGALDGLAVTIDDPDDSAHGQTLMRDWRRRAQAAPRPGEGRGGARGRAGRGWRGRGCSCPPGGNAPPGSGARGVKSCTFRCPARSIPGKNWSAGAWSPPSRSSGCSRKLGSVPVSRHIVIANRRYADHGGLRHAAQVQQIAEMERRLDHGNRGDRDLEQRTARRERPPVWPHRPESVARGSEQRGAFLALGRRQVRGPEVVGAGERPEVRGQRRRIIRCSRGRRGPRTASDSN